MEPTSEDTTPTTELAPRAHGLLRRLVGPLDQIDLWRALRAIVVVFVSLVLVAATLERLVEPATFSSFGRAVWWAVVTVATVGYGDIVPASAAGRAVAAGVIIGSMALIPLTTSVIVSALVTRAGTARRDEDSGRLDAICDQLDRIESRLDELDRRG